MTTPTTDAGPGFLAFVAFFVLALALWFLMRNMNARMRRMSYRQQAAHRGKDDPQAAPEELVPETDGPVAGAAGHGEEERGSGPVDATDDEDGPEGRTGTDEQGPDTGR